MNSDPTWSQARRSCASFPLIALARPCGGARHSENIASKGVKFAARVLDSLDSDRARNRWGRWNGVRNVIAYTIWFFRFRGRYPPLGP